MGGEKMKAKKMKFEIPKMLKLEKTVKSTMYGGESGCSAGWSSCCYKHC